MHARAGSAAPMRHRAHIDNDAEFVGQHMRQHLLHGVEGAFDVEVEGAREQVVVDVEKVRPPHGRAGRVEQEMRRAEITDRQFDDVFHRRALGHVDRQRQTAARRVAGFVLLPAELRVDCLGGSGMVLKKSTDGLGVDRAYEQGVILMLPRLIIESIYPPASCNPRIRTVRFHLLSGLGIAQHSISGLIKELRHVAGERAAVPHRVDDRTAARGCHGRRLMLMTPPA
jgi:hypothetical protein